MEPNESSSYSDNREYFQILERQRKDFLKKILWKCDNGPCKMETTLRTPEETQEDGEGSIETYPTFPEGEEEQGGTRELQVQLSVPGSVVRRIRSTEVHGRIPARRNGKELSLEGSVQIGWDNTPEDTKANILAGDSKSVIADRLGRLIKIHFIGDGYFEGSRTKKAREYTQALFGLELRNICAVDEYIYWFRKYFFQSGVATEVAPMFFAKICSPWREMLIQAYKVPEGQLDSVCKENVFLKDKLKDWCYQASIQKNMKRLRGRTPTRRTFRRAHTRANESFKDCNCWTCGAKGHISPDCPQKRGELCKFEATKDILDIVYYGDLVPIYQFEDIPSDESVYEEEIETEIDPHRNYEVVIKATFKKEIDSEIHLSIMDRRINNLRDGCLGTMIGRSILRFRIFKEFAKVMTPDPVRIPRIGGVDIVIKDHPVLERTISTRIEFSSRMSFLEDRITGYRGKEKELIKIFTPQEIRQPVISKYEGMLEIAGHEILVAEYFAAYIDSGSGICTAKSGVFPKEAMETLPVIAGRDFSQKILILNKGIKEAKIMIGGAFGTPWFRVKTPPIYFYDTGADILLGNNFIQTFAKYIQDNNRNLLIFTTNCGSEIQDRRKFGKALLSFRQQGLIDSDSFYKESEEDIKDLQEALQETKSLDISEESKLSLENVKRLIQRNFSENPLAWWERNKIEATLKVKEECKYEYVRYKHIQMNMEDKKDMQMIIKEHINLDSSSQESLPTVALDHIVEKIRNFPDVLKDKKHLQSFLGVVNFAGIFIKDLAKYIKDFQPLLNETESSKWKWEEIHTQRVRELKQICSNLSKLVIPQDEDELVVYIDANDYRWQQCS
ncbi:UNVERIFIED_CONTAM: hypothetical protein Sradi_0772700 [Sesamum radiatum]|uniref:RNA-directed DNA polymerase n=1 Tax=Sesamum radiatum TaxID=300843 RepID=A0AAW2VQF9_SESRA